MRPPSPPARMADIDGIDERVPIRQPIRLTPIALHAHDQRLDITVLRMPWRSVRRKAPLPGLSTTGSPAYGVERGHDVGPASPRIRMCPIGPGSPMRLLGAPRSTLAIGRIGHVRRVPLTVWTTSMPTVRARSEHPLQGPMAALSNPTSVAENLPEAARLEEVLLHVDDHERGPRGSTWIGAGLGVDW